MPRAIDTGKSVAGIGEHILLRARSSQSWPDPRLEHRPHRRTLLHAQLRRHLWIGAIERKLAAVSAVKAIEIGVLLLVLWGISSLLEAAEALTFLIAGILGIVTFIAVESVNTALESMTRSAAWCAKHGAASLDFESVYFVLSPDYNRYMGIQQTINFAIHKAFAQRGIEFAYPTQMLYLARAGKESKAGTEEVLQEGAQWPPS